jgi:hypothetical protein
VLPVYIGFVAKVYQFAFGIIANVFHHRQSSRGALRRGKIIGGKQKAAARKLSLRFE